MVARSLLTKMAEICGDVFLWSCDRCPSDKKCCNLCEIRIQGSRGSFSSFKCSQHHFAANVQYPCRQTGRQAPELQHGKEWEAMIRNVLRKTFVFFEQPLRRNVNSFQGSKTTSWKMKQRLGMFQRRFRRKFRQTDHYDRLRFHDPFRFQNVPEHACCAVGSQIPPQSSGDFVSTLYVYYESTMSMSIMMYYVLSMF